MNYAFLSSILVSPWQVDWNTFTQYYPVLRGVFNGLAFGDGKEPENSVPYQMGASSASSGGSSQSDERVVQVIPIRGIMLKHDMPCGPVGMRTVGNRLLSGEKKKNVVGSILLFESGGGQTMAVPEITDAIKACKKPVVAYVDGMTCSAAMYAASFCKEIIASRETDIVGSIGTLIAFENVEKFGKDDRGMVHVRVYADGSEDKNGMFEDAITGNFNLIKEQVLNPHNERFKTDIKANRPKVEAKHLTGRSWEAREVMGILVDAIGTLQYAANRVAEIAQAEKEDKINSSNNILGMKNFPLLLAALGMSEIAVDADGFSSFTEQQLSAVEAALSAANLNLRTAQDARTRAETDLQTANTAKTKLETDLQTANSRITVLEKELAKKPGAESADDEGDTDQQPKGEESFYGRFARMNKEFDY
jgi:ClpP class serine protease